MFIFKVVKFDLINFMEAVKERRFTGTHPNYLSPRMICGFFFFSVEKSIYERIA